MNLGGNIKKARKNAGVTQKELADCLQVYQKDISRWENNELTPSAVTLAKICRELNVSADEILELNIDAKNKKREGSCMDMKAWKELEGLFILLENSEELDKRLKDMADSSEYFLNVLEHLSPLHGLEMPENTIEYYTDQIAKLYAVCYIDKELDRKLGSEAGIESGYLTIALEKVIPVNARRKAVKVIK